jgi:hypothetical protein
VSTAGGPSARTSSGYVGMGRECLYARCCGCTVSEMCHAREKVRVGHFIEKFHWPHVGCLRAGGRCVRHRWCQEGCTCTCSPRRTASAYCLFAPKLSHPAGPGGRYTHRPWRSIRLWGVKVRSFFSRAVGHSTTWPHVILDHGGAGLRHRGCAADTGRER